MAPPEATEQVVSRLSCVGEVRSLDAQLAHFE
jgi:hypothetical protein